jgi:DNA polymerase I-like protein with 3'-5' exonuclease and polymerase domains
LYIWKYDWFQEWLINGGKIYDTQLAEYVLSGQRHKYPALRDIAVNKYGCKEREKKMEAYWDNGVDTKDIPKELVLEDVQNDVLDTEQVMLKQIHIAKKEGMMSLIMEMMEGLLCTTEIEYNGMYIDRNIFIGNKDALERDIKLNISHVEQLSLQYWR